LIFKEQAKVKHVGLREKGLDQTHYPLQHIEGYDILYYKSSKQDLNSAIIDYGQRVLSWYHEYLIRPGQTKTEKTIRNTMTWPGLTQDVEHVLLMFNL
jgi:hypothetical protein